jgi:hypothetical protein
VTACFILAISCWDFTCAIIWLISMQDSFISHMRTDCGSQILRYMYIMYVVFRSPRFIFLKSGHNAMVINHQNCRPKRIAIFMRKKLVFLYFYFSLLYIIFTLSMLSNVKYGAPKQNMNKSISEKIFIPEYNFIFILSSGQIF